MVLLWENQWARRFYCHVSRPCLNPVLCLAINRSWFQPPVSGTPSLASSWPEDTWHPEPTSSPDWPHSPSVPHCLCSSQYLPTVKATQCLLCLDVENQVSAPSSGWEEEWQTLDLAWRSDPSFCPSAFSVFMPYVFPLLLPQSLLSE